MSNEYAENYYDASLNTYGSTLSGSYAEPLLPPNFTILREYTVGTPRKRQVDWEIHLDENRGPQAQADTFSKGYAGWSSTTADRRFRGYLFNPLKTTTTQFSSGNTGYGASNAGPLVWAIHDNILVMAYGNDQGAMQKETSATDPTPVAVSYDPNAYITGLFSAPLNGTNYLWVGRSGTTTDLHSTIGTSAATMHTDFNNFYGGAISGVGVTAGTPTILAYCGTNIRRQPITAATGDAAASTPLQNIPANGAVLGIDTLEKSPFGSRMYMLWPEKGVSSTWYIQPNNVKLEVWHISEEGTAPEHMQLSLRPIGGRLWQRNGVFHDYTRVVRHDGEREHDLNIFGNIAANSNIKWSVLNVGGSDSVLRALVQKWDLSSQSDSRLQWWEFMPQTTSWLPVSAEITPLSTGTVTDGAFYNNGLTVGPNAINLPYSKQHGSAFIRLHQTLDQAFAWQLVNPQGINPFNAYRKTGSTDYASKAFETSSVDTRPAWMLPGRLGSKPFSITEIDARLMDIEAGGTDASVQFQVAMHSTASTALSFTGTPLSVTFKANQGVKERVYKPRAEHRLYRLQVRETLTQGTGETNKTPNGAYGIIRGTSYLDE